MPVTLPDLVEVSDDVPDVSVHPQREEEHTGQLTQGQQQSQVVDVDLPHALTETHNTT